MASVYLYVIGNFFNGRYNPGEKKEPSPRFTARRTLFHVWYYARSSAIRAGQKSRTVADDLALHWSPVIKHDITRSKSVLLTAALGDGSFFLSRVVECAAFLRVSGWHFYNRQVALSIFKLTRWKVERAVSMGFEGCLVWLFVCVFAWVHPFCVCVCVHTGVRVDHHWKIGKWEKPNQRTKISIQLSRLHCLKCFDS